MDKQDSELMNKIRQQFDTAPYPRQPLETSANDDPNFLVIHNLATPYYVKNKKFINTEGKIILDAGCGSGYKALVLAEANPGAKIIGIDISEESVKLARNRLKYHGFVNAEFYTLSIEDLPELGKQFEYINCDEVLYLLPDPISGLKAMKKVLKPEGIIRANLHSSLQRNDFYRVQKIFKMMGLMDKNPQKLEIQLVCEIMESLKNNVIGKAKTWYFDEVPTEQSILMNYLFHGDKGFTISEMFSALNAVDLEFVSMVNWPQWELIQLFKEPDNLPTFLGAFLSEISVEDRLHLFELLHPIHRLLDFWCAHPNPNNSYLPIVEWQFSDWQGALVHLHPQLITHQAKQYLIDCIANNRLFEISSCGSIPINGSLTIESSSAAFLLPLWDGPLTVMSLVERWHKLNPLHPVTLEPVSEEKAIDEVKKLLMKLETFLYVLLERSP